MLNDGERRDKRGKRGKKAAAVIPLRSELDENALLLLLLDDENVSAT